MKNIFWVLVILDIFWGETVDAGPEPTYEEQIRVASPPPPGSPCDVISTEGPI